MIFCWHRYVLTAKKGIYIFKCLKCRKEVDGNKGVLGIFYTGRSVCMSCFEEAKEK